MEFRIRVIRVAIKRNYQQPFAVHPIFRNIRDIRNRVDGTRSYGRSSNRRERERERAVEKNVFRRNTGGYANDLSARLIFRRGRSG